jgi:alkylhydroperoxidase family enzyme
MATQAATTTQKGTFLPPIEKPEGLFLKMGYAYLRRQFGKVFTPMSVFSARMPSAFTRFYGKIGKLDKKLEISPSTVALIREQVATTNACAFCMDATRLQATKDSRRDLARFDALAEYQTSDLFRAAERALLDYVTELTEAKRVDADTFARLAQHYSDRQICNIVWVAASEHLFNVTNIALNIGSDGLCEIAAAKQ